MHLQISNHIYNDIFHERGIFMWIDANGMENDRQMINRLTQCQQCCLHQPAQHIYHHLGLGQHPHQET